MMENSENSLSFFTTNHSNHSSQWRMNGANTSVVCVACLVELLENTDVVNLRKRKVLGELIVLLVNNQNLLELLTQNAKITSHLGKILMDLLSTENELLMNTTIEALDILIVKVRSEILVEEMVGNLEGKILQLNNFKKSYPFVLTLGRFLKSIPALSLRVAKDSQSLVEYLLENILYPEEDIKTAFLFVLVEICSNEGAFNALKSQVQEEICRKTCAVVACGLAVNVQRNSLGIMRLLSQKSDVLGTALKTSNKGTPAILESLKKLMLSSTEAIQIGAIQCVTRILRNDPEDNTYTKAILTSGIGELLLGDLESSNDLVLGSVFCSLDHMVRTHTFYSDGFSVYGVDSIIIGISKAIRLKNSDIVRQGLRVLSLVLSTHPRCVQLFPNEEISKKCASVLLETFKATDHRVLIEAACAVEHFLGIHLHPLSMEFEVVVPLVTAIISQLQKFTNPRMHFRNIPTGPVEAFLYAILKTIKKTFNFIEEFRAKEPSYDALLTRNHRSIATANDSLDHLLQSLWKSIDQLCVPAVIYNCKSFENPAVFAIFFQILHISLSPKNSYGERFAHKLASGSFVRLSLEIKEKFYRMAENTELTEAIALFLAELCVACSNAADRIQLKDRLKTESINSIYSKSVAINLLAQNSVRRDTGEINDESLFNTQCCCIELLYLSFTHGDEIIHLEELVMCLHKFLIQHPDLSVFYRISLKHLLFLCLIAFNKLRSTPLSSSISQSVKDTQKILEDSFMRFSPDEFDDVYFQDVMFVSWIISSESLSEKFGRQVLICFIQKAEEERDLCMFDAFREVLKSSLPGLIPLISLVDYREENVVSIVVKVLEALITEVSALESDSDGSSNADMPKPISLANLVTNIFQKLFLGNKVKPLPDHSIAAMLKIMTALQINFPAAFEIKLLYQVVNVLTSANICQRFTIPAINYLNVALAWGLHEENLQVPSVLLANEALYEFIQRILDTMQVKDVENPTCPCHLKAGILVLISSLALSLSNVSHNCREPFKVSKQCMVTFTNERESILGITSLIFWDVYFRTTERTSCQPILELHGMVHGDNRCLKLSDVDQDVLHVYLQNSLVHDSEIVRLCAVKCLGSFLCYVPDASSYASSPWNNVVLECSLSLLSAKVMTSGLVLFCSLMLKHAPEKHASTQILSNTVQSILIKIPDISCSEKALSWNCIYLLAKVLSLEHYSMLQVQWGLISIWLQAFKDSVSASRAQNDGSKEGFTFYTLDGLIIAKDLLKTRNDEDPRLLDKAILLVRNKVDKEIEQATSQCTSE